MKPENDNWLREKYPGRILEDGRVIPGWLVVIHWKDRYLGWGATNKKPVVYNIHPSDFHKSLSHEWGPYSSIASSAHMHLAKEYGSDLGPTVTPQQIVKGNSLGDGGEELDLEQILEKFALEGMDPELGTQFSYIEMAKSPTKEEVEREKAWIKERFVESIEKHKRVCSEYGFPFD